MDSKNRQLQLMVKIKEKDKHCLISNFKKWDLKMILL